MSSTEQPVDPVSREALAAHGLRLGLVPPDDEAAQRAWIRAVSRGFHDGEPSEAQLAETAASLRDRRVAGVWDDRVAEPAVPVATIDGWRTEVTMPGGGTVPAWAISAVSVAPTHRRRGVARALLEAELRHAVRSGLPVAALTVSEATIYRRYGFGPATWAAAIELDVRRAGWRAPEPAAVVQFVSREAAIEAGGAVHECARRSRPGETPLSGILLERLFGLPSDGEELRSLRYLRADDADGVPQGVAAYRVREDQNAFDAATIEVRTLQAATADAEAALWRFLLGIDLVARIRASLRPVEDPLAWLVEDARAVRTTAVREHHWLRVLEPAAALASRRYGAPLRVVLGVRDVLGHADGNWALAIAPDGAGVAERTDLSPDVELDVAELGTLLLGGVRAEVLAKAGLLRGDERGVRAVEAAFRSPATPWLSTWY